MRVEGAVQANRTSNKVAYGYDADSDLEECEVELSAGRSTTSPPTQTVDATVNCTLISHPDNMLC